MKVPRYKSNWNSFTTLLLIGYSITTILLAGSFTILVYENQIDLIAENALYASLQTGESIRKSVESAASGPEGADWNAVAESVRAAFAARDDSVRNLELFDDRGELLHSREADEPTIDDVREIQTAIAKREFENRLFHHRIDIRNRWIDLYIPCDCGQEGTVVVKATLAMPQIDRRIDYLKRQAGLLVAMVFVLHIGFAFFAFRTAIRPFRLISLAIDRVARGDYDIHLPRFRTQEFATVTDKIQQMSYAVRDMQDSARSANPLTGLPGNVELERRISAQIESGKDYCILYGDLDNFKAYNDAYGFNRGDDVLLYTRDVFQRAVSETHAAEAFVGHQGGDDFVITCNPDHWEPLARRCTGLFDEGIKDYYSETDRTNGYIDSVDRNGRKARFPIVSLSIAVVTNAHRQFDSIGELAKVAAEVKKYVKSIEGSAYAIDRRNN